MLNVKLFLIIVLMGWNMASAMACKEMNVSAPKVAPGSLIILTCSTEIEVKQIAAEITGDQWNASIPNLYDDGSHGDKVGGDRTFSFSLNASETAGKYQVKFFRILPDQSEMESPPLTLTVE